MAVDTVVAHTESEPGPDDPILKAQGDTALERWFLYHTALVGEIKGILRIHIHVQGLTETSKYEEAVRDAERRDLTLATTLDPTSNWVSGFAFCPAPVVLIRTVSLALSPSRAAVRYVRQDVARARVEQQAAYAGDRHLAGLRHAPLPRACDPAAPARTDHAVWAAVLGLTIRRSFAAS
jgi:hypothetical protein